MSSNKQVKPHGSASELNQYRFKHANVLQRMLQSLRSQYADPDKPNDRPLSSLTTRDKEDPIIAMLDACAMMLDVLGFYQQRINTESYLGTAIERRSLRELGRMIGYELSPGLAASTYLAFTVDDSGDSSRHVALPQGLRVQSIPQQNDELPQTFETNSEFTAKAEWNRLLVSQTERSVKQLVNSNKRYLQLQGVATRLKVGDALLLTNGEDKSESQEGHDSKSSDQLFVTLVEVEQNAEKNYTEVRWGEADARENHNLENPTVFALRQQLGAFGYYNAPPPVVKLEDTSDLMKLLKEIENTSVCEGLLYRGGDWAIEYNDALPNGSHLYLSRLLPQIVPGGWAVLTCPASNEEGKRIGIFKIESVSSRTLVGFGLTEKVTGLSFQGVDYVFMLKNKGKPSPEVKERGIYLYRHGKPEQVSALIVYNEKSRETLNLTEISEGSDKEKLLGQLVWPAEGEGDCIATNLSKKLMDLIVLKCQKKDPPQNPLKDYLLRDTTVYVQSERLSLYDEKKQSEDEDAKIKGKEIILDREVPEFRPNHRLILSSVDTDHNINTETITVESTKNENGHAHLILSKELKRAYDPATVVLYGNVVEATHGETVNEVLGSGDGSAINQQFKLKRAPLTYTQGDHAGLIKNSLEVQVNDILWHEVSSLHTENANSRSYTVRHAEDGQVYITFGDGEKGSRLLSGQNNVQAKYRVGIGSPGELPADALTLLLTPILGIKAVTNPIATTGASNPETLEEVRRRACRPLLTMKRVVSLHDVENFIRAFSGIDKVQTSSLQLGHQTLLLVTIASQSGDKISKDDSLIKNLKSALDAEQCYNKFLIGVLGCKYLEFNVEVNLHIDSDYQVEIIKRQVMNRLSETFGFHRRELGEPITASEITAVIQSIPGIIAVDFNDLFLDQSSDNANKREKSRLDKKKVRINANTAKVVSISDEGIDFLPAELLIIKNVGIEKIIIGDIELDKMSNSK